MTTFTFAAIVLCYGLAAAYFLWRFNLKRRLTSLALALVCLGWPVAAARELKLLPRDFGATPLYGIAFLVGVLLVVAILRNEAQQPRPFR